ncbi:leucine-rich repeat and calponin homology domain-containing protein 4-like [Sinocyclocheilus grahami]|uniref:leucine-rich repeat and calponin homology domain-containing protein 4-like n=1 Tax=Sinocyclocheilus grahami TaxID=75366 RepID=UPI0007AD437A|nr:PREDICTED: leucine-rich repeat and calponin homology domain-containing protein 4-like [Sinocyclocheilus grahami]
MAAGDGAQLPATVAASRSVEKALEEAASSGALILSNRKLKEFPRTAKNYDLSDVTHADLSKNRLCEVPEEVCQFVSLETLSLYHNCVRSLTPSLCQLQALTYLNLRYTHTPPQIHMVLSVVCDKMPLKLLVLSVVNGDLEQVNFIDNSVTEEEEERCHPPLTEPPQEKSESTSSTSSQSPESTCSRIFVIGDGSDSGSPSSPTLEERRRPGNLLIWQERERAQQQRDRTSTLQKMTVKTGSNLATTTKHGGTGSVSGGDSDSNAPPNGLKQRCASVDQVSPSSQSGSLQRSISRPDASSVKPCSPTGSAPKPNSFLFRTSSRCNVKTGSGNSLAESGCSDSRSTLRSPREERTDILQLRKTLESRLKISVPEDLGEALSNGTILCQLANHVRPRSVSIIHIPSPAVDTLCPPQLILEEEGLTRIAQTVQALLELPTSGSRRSSRQDPSGLPLQSTTQNQDAAS